MQPAAGPPQPPPYVVCQPSTMTAPSNTVIIQTDSPVSYQPLNYANKQSLGLGITQIICGLVAIVVMSVLLGEVSHCYTATGSGYGIWCGVFYLVAGALGISAARRPSQCQLVAHMVMSIIAACFAGTHFSIAVDESRYSLFRCSNRRSFYEYEYGYYGYRYANDKEASVIRHLSLVLAAFALLEVVVAIWASALCCSATCCRTPTRQGYAANTVVTNPIQTMYQEQQFPYVHLQPQYVQSLASGPQATCVTPYSK